MMIKERFDMSLQFITGRSGAGKTRYMTNMMIEESMHNPDTDYLIIVPEQFTLLTQKEVVSAHPDKGIINIDVLSFNRLAYRVFDEIGKKAGLILADTGKNMVLRRVIEANKDKLGVYGRNYDKQGFISEIKSFISELYQYSISPDTLENFIGDNPENELINRKLSEVHTIYKAFQEYLNERYITSEELLDILAGVIDRSRMIKNSVICLDGYTGFTPSQAGLLRKMIALSKKMYVTLTIDPKIKHFSKTSLFYLTARTKEKLTKLAMDEKVCVEEDIDVALAFGFDESDGQIRFADSKELSFLENNIFRLSKKVYDKENEDIKIYAMLGQRDEVEMVAQEILKLASMGYEYRQMAVVCGDIDRYGNLARSIFEKKGIPCFVDNKKKVMNNPYVDTLLSVFDIVRNNFSFNSVFRYLRCGMSDVLQEEADILENYVLAMGIKHESQWKKQWVADKNKRYSEKLDEINIIREKFYGELEGVGKLFPAKAKVSFYADSAIEISKRLRCEEKLAVMADKFANCGDYILEKEYEKIYDMVMELFEQMKKLLGDVKVELDEFRKIFEAGAAEIKIGVIPIATDQIVVGDIERTRVSDIKALFMIGANDGVIPKESKKGSVISDIEREKLVSMGLELAPTRRESAFIGQFYLYLNMTKPSKKLYITYSLMGEDAKPQSESFVIKRIMGLFPKMKLITSKDELRDSGREYMLEALSLRENEPLGNRWNEVVRWNLLSDEGKRCIDKMLDAAFNYHKNDNIGKELADRLFVQMPYSTSRLEKYATCAYAHFLRYGLGLIKRDEYEISVPDMGIIFHSVMEGYSRQLYERKIAWGDVEEELSKKIIDDCISDCVNDFGNGILFSSSRNIFKVGQIRRMAKRACEVLTKHVKEGEFVPAGFEVNFVNEIQNEEGKKQKIIGKIDRIDTCQHDNGAQELVKIIDYKSGKKDFDTALFENGIDMQLVVYMDAAVSSAGKIHKKDGVKVIPAGAFYFRFNDPVIDADDSLVKNNNGVMEYDDEKIEEKIYKEMKMKGIVNCEDGIINRVEEGALFDEKGKFVSNVMDIKTDAKGGKTVGGYGMTKTDEFMALIEYTHKKIDEIDEKIKIGDIIKNPYRYCDSTACDYCEFAGICRFDISNGEDFRNIKPVKFVDFLKRLSDEQKGSDNDEGAYNNMSEDNPKNDSESDGKGEKGGLKDGVD